VSVEYRTIRPGASEEEAETERWIASRGHWIDDPFSSGGQLFGVVRDITGRKKAEAERNVSMIMRQALVQFKLGSSGSLWGGLIQTAVGLAGGTGGFLTKRSGLASKA